MPTTDVIVANCKIAQKSMSQLEKADIGTRINRGYNYDRILDLMFSLNTRLASNRIAAPKLNEVTADVESQIATFRNDYADYDDALSQAISTNCAESPEEFYAQLVNARSLRGKLHQSVEKLDSSINSYYDEFDTIAKGQKW